MTSAVRQSSALFPAHEYALTFPPMTPDEFATLKQSIEREGLLEPITLYSQQVLDGVHRQRACDELRVKLRFEEWEKMPVERRGASPLDYVVAKNMARRHLTTSQRITLAALLVQHYSSEIAQEESAREAQGHDASGRFAPLSTGTSTQRQKGRNRATVRAAKAMQVGRSSVELAQTVLRADPVLFEKVKAGGPGAPSVEAAYRSIKGARPPRPPRGTPRKQKKQGFDPDKMAEHFVEVLVYELLDEHRLLKARRKELSAKHDRRMAVAVARLSRLTWRVK